MSSTFVTNERLGYVIGGNHEYVIAYGKARAIDYDIKYRQNKKNFGHYLSIGRSTYFHMFGIGNTKRRNLIYAKDFSTHNYNVISADHDIRHVVVASDAIYNKTVQFAFGFLIIMRKNIAHTKAQTKRYRKNNDPIIYTHTRKIDYPDYGCAFVFFIHRRIKVDKIPFKPMYIPMVGVKNMPQVEEEEED